MRYFLPKRKNPSPDGLRACCRASLSLSMPMGPFFIGAMTWMSSSGSKAYFLGRRCDTSEMMVLGNISASFCSIKKKSLSGSLLISG